MIKTVNKADLFYLTLLVLLLVGGFLVVPVQPETAVETGQVTDIQEVIKDEAPVVGPLEPVFVSNIPDFNAIRDVRTKKQEFFNFMLPMVRESNAQIRVQRAELAQLKNQLRMGETLTQAQGEWLSRKLRRYRIKPVGSQQQQIDDLLLRVDVVPASLVLAQSANESGWGTSRFAREANNLFGVWCFQPGCGLKPRARDVGLTHEVARYQSVQDSVSAYIHTINTNPAYEELRGIRAAARIDSQHMTGLALAEGLLKYSARGLDYVREIQQLIRVNNLQQYTLPLKA